MPRPSKVITRKWRARYGICVFQIREWTIDQVGRSSTVGLAVAEDLLEDPDAVALDEALVIRIARARLLSRRAPASSPRLAGANISAWADAVTDALRTPG